MKSSITESALRRRAHRMGKLLRKTPCGNFRVLSAETGKPYFRRGFNHPRTLREITDCLDTIRLLRALVRGRKEGS